ncbi:hypothetical protein LZ554_000107 [Drepanopeziza brunnea f. sp. 'monogermtubi']|nr:hypothetical protein LZ554_000107 [Drepanopeziza brunnea f. sp. 'monogermtubi']
MAARPGEDLVATLFADIHYYYGSPAAKPPHHRFDKGSYVYLFENASQRGARIEVANNAGTAEQDAFTGHLDAAHVQYSYKHSTLVTLTVQGVTEQQNSPVDGQDWHLPTFDLRNETKYMYKLHTLDIYFWMKEDAVMFMNGIRRVLPQHQVSVQDEPYAPPPHPQDMSPAVQQLENIAITDPSYQQGRTRDSRTSTVSSFPGPPISATPQAQEASNFAPMAYNPAAPAAPEVIRHREKTPPPEDGAVNPLMAAAASDQGQTLGAPYGQQGFSGPPQRQQSISGPPQQPPAQQGFPGPPQQAPSQQQQQSISGPPQQPPAQQGFPGPPQQAPSQQQQQSISGPPQQPPAQHGFPGPPQQAPSQQQQQSYFTTVPPPASAPPSQFNQPAQKAAPMSPLAQHFQNSFAPPPTASDVSSLYAQPPQAGTPPSDAAPPGYQQQRRSSNIPVSQFANYPGSPGMSPATSTPGIYSPGVGTPITGPPAPAPHVAPPGGFSQHQYASVSNTKPLMTDYSIHQQVYRPTENEAYKPAKEVKAPRGNLEKRAGQLEKGMGSFFKKLEKKIG